MANPMAVCIFKTRRHNETAKRMAPSTLNAPSATPATTADGELGLTTQQLSDFERDGARLEEFSFRKSVCFFDGGFSIGWTRSLQPRPRDLDSRLSASHSPLPTSLLKTATNNAGFLVIPDFASQSQVSSLLSRGRNLLSTFDPASVASVFSTRDQSASVSAKYFAESASKVSFFFEEGAVVAKEKEGEAKEEEKREREEKEGAGGEEAGVAFNGATLSAPSLPGAFSLSVPKENAVNKIGHALHDEDDSFRAFSRENPRLLALLKCLNFERPTPVQSMYICKPPKLGGEVVPHQDACFLRTEPRRSVTGCWLALERAGVDNGCLWAVPGSHKEKVEGNGDGGEGLFLGHGRVFGRRGDGSVGWSDQSKGGEEPSGPPEFSTEGAVPLEAQPGTLVVLDGAVVHFSRARAANDDDDAASSSGQKKSSTSSTSRHAFALHFVEGGKGITWSKGNWLQRDEEKPFAPVY